MSNRKKLAKMVRDLRNAYKLNQTEMGKSLGISQATLSQIESGRRDLPLSAFLKAFQSVQVSDRVEHGQYWEWHDFVSGDKA